MDLDTTLKVVTAFGSVGSFAMASWLYLVARNFRQLDWLRQQNDAWNKFNEAKFGKAAHFEAAEAFLFEGASIGTLTYEGEAAVHLRMNILERDVRGITSRLVMDSDYEFVVRELLKMNANREAIIAFLRKENYDRRFVHVVDKVLTIGSQSTSVRYDDLQIREVFENCQRALRS